MLNIKDILQNRSQNIIVENSKLEKSERSNIIKELYSIHTSESERIHRKKENWKRYIKYLKSFKKTDSEQIRIIFKKKKEFIKEIPIRNFCILIGHIPTKDLYYIKSQMVNCKNRGSSATAWLISNLRVK